MKVNKFLFFLIPSLFMACFCFGLPPEERNHAFFLGVADFNNGDFNDAVSIFSELKQDGYEVQSPVLIYYLGKVYRKLGRQDEKGNRAELELALANFQQYKKLTIKYSQEYKAAVVMIAFTYADLGYFFDPINFQNAKNEIDTFLNETPNIDDKNDGSVRLCKSDVYNASGYHEINKNPVGAIEDLKIAYSGHEINWPTFSNNLICAYIGAANADENNAKNYLCEAYQVYLKQENKGYWKNDQKFLTTGNTLLSAITERKLKCVEPLK